MGARYTMAVRANRDKMKVDTLAFEARYQDGFRYLDHCGEALVQIQRRSRLWVVNNVGTHSGQLRNEELNLLLTFNHVGLGIQVLKSPIEMVGSDKLVEILGQEAEATYQIITDTLKLTDTTRVGARFRFLAEADSLEDADRFLRQGMTSPLSEAVEAATGSKFRDASVSCVVEDLESGRRKRIEIVSVLQQKPTDSQYTGFDPESRAAFVAIDIDTFTRPGTGHYPRSSMFIQESYIGAQSAAMEILEWFRRPQSVKRR
jgi:hypothetical protein